MELDKLKELLGLDPKDISNNGTLNFIIFDIKEIILNYCNVEELPKGLVNTAYRMAIDAYRNENIGQEENSLGSISSISEGDTTVNYRSSAAEFKDSLIKDYKVQLNQYRKIRW